MRRIAIATSALALAVLVVVAFGQVQALEPVRSGQDSFVLRAAVSDGRLWLLSDSGRLSRSRSTRSTASKKICPNQSPTFARAGAC